MSGYEKVWLNKSASKWVDSNIRIKELKKLYGSGTIVDNMNRIMQLVEDNKRIREGRYE